jgi:hypothetical protein
MRRVLAIAVVLVAPAAHADRVLVPSVAAGLAVGGSSVADSPVVDNASYTTASLAWEKRDHDGLTLAPEVAALGVWHGAATPIGLAGLRLDVAVAPTTTLSFGARAGAADDRGGLHPAGDASLAIHAGARVQLGFELALTSWRATMMMGGDPMSGSLMFARLGITLSAPL